MTQLSFLKIDQLYLVVWNNETISVDIAMEDANIMEALKGRLARPKILDICFTSFKVFSHEADYTAMLVDKVHAINGPLEGR